MPTEIGPCWVERIPTPDTQEHRGWSADFLAQHLKSFGTKEFTNYTRARIRMTDLGPWPVTAPIAR